MYRRLPKAFLPNFKLHQENQDQKVALDDLGVQNSVSKHKFYHLNNQYLKESKLTKNTRRTICFVTLLYVYQNIQHFIASRVKCRQMNTQNHSF